MTRPPGGAIFIAALMGRDETPYLFSTSAGNGFITRLGELQSRTRTGTSVVTLPKGSVVPLIRCPIYDLESDWICCVHSNGNLLVFPASEVPEMTRGKGSRLLDIPAKKFASKEERQRLVAIASVPANGELVVYAGKRHKRLRRQELEHYFSERGKRGLRLPRGFRSVGDLGVEL